MSFKEYKKIDKVSFKMYSICSLSDYIDLLKSINLNINSRWYRGQSSSEYRLIPSAYRDCYAIADKYGNSIIPHSVSLCDDSRSDSCVFLPVDRMVDEFRLKSENIIEYAVENNLQWECIAQHYGLPTRMLDWTTNPLDALYFAINDSKKAKLESIEEACEDFEDSGGFSDKGAAVFIIDPIEINKLSVCFGNELKSKPCILDTVKHYKYIKYRMNATCAPVCINGIITEKRICRQSGNFVAFGKLLWAFDYYNIFQNVMIKVFIPFAAFSNINKDLKALGITKSSIYMGKDNKDKIAKEICNSAYEKFYEDLGISEKK